MKCDKKDLLLYAVTDRHWLDGRKLIDVVRESLDGGVTMLQLREKALAEEKFLEEARELQALCRERHVPFIVNDNVDIAKAMDADGVHVGQDDMEALDVRAKLGPDKIIGVSAHSVEEALLAEKHGADYLGVGAMFPTGSKADVQGHLAVVQQLEPHFCMFLFVAGGFFEYGCYLVIAFLLGGGRIVGILIPGLAFARKRSHQIRFGLASLEFHF